jgi:hypothetical protein
MIAVEERVLVLESRRFLTVKKRGAEAVAWAGHGRHGGVYVQRGVVLQHLAEHGAVRIPSTQDVNLVADSNSGMIRQRP